ncbi:MAG: helix-turn-helix domain-containing protein [Mesorhizobium sp.]|nr:MAG: helix-turn-helix domain-containing protein [Mesorhizobium sp.]
MLHWRLVYRRLSEPDCSDRLAARHQRCSDLQPSRGPGGTSRCGTSGDRTSCVQGLSRRETGRRLGRSASTISRELRRNAATRSGGLEYRASTT